jgi:hypothetical protein
MHSRMSSIKIFTQSKYILGRRRNDEKQLKLVLGMNIKVKIFLCLTE